MPGFIEPCDPTLHERAPVGSDWVYEIKTDGYRAQVHLRNKRVTIYSPIAKAATQLKVREASTAKPLSLATLACQTSRHFAANCEIPNQSD